MITFLFITIIQTKQVNTLKTKINWCSDTYITHQWINYSQSSK